MWRAMHSRTISNDTHTAGGEIISCGGRGNSGMAHAESGVLLINQIRRWPAPEAARRMTMYPSWHRCERYVEQAEKKRGTRVTVPCTGVHQRAGSRPARPDIGPSGHDAAHARFLAGGLLRACLSTWRSNKAISEITGDLHPVVINMGSCKP